MTQTLTSKQIDAAVIARPFMHHREAYARHKRLETRIAEHMHATVCDVQVPRHQGGGRPLSTDRSQVKEILRRNPGISVTGMAEEMQRSYNFAQAALAELVRSGDVLVGKDLHENGRSRYAAYYLKGDV